MDELVVPKQSPVQKAALPPGLGSLEVMTEEGSPCLLHKIHFGNWSINWVRWSLIVTHRSCSVFEFFCICQSCKTMLSFYLVLCTVSAWGSSFLCFQALNVGYKDGSCVFWSCLGYFRERNVLNPLECSQNLHQNTLLKAVINNILQVKDLIWT